ncbi:MAG: signal peptidase I [Spartobacteria bacterium]|nr:signal peptidase I [Spartobacteria bacterium]
MDAWKARDAEAMDAAAERLSNQIQSLYPSKHFSKVRENLEILVVALVVAMGFRTYFIQPFKIPTGSMQPSLYGITYAPQAQPSLADRFPLNLVRLALFGQKYKEVKAKADGQAQMMISRQDGAPQRLIQVGGYMHPVEDGMLYHVDNGDYVKRGQVLASGVRTIGDHIFVNKVKYNFVRPKRGDVFVFDTSNIRHSQIRPKSYYIKRLVGLPNEEIAIDQPYLVVNGKRVETPYPFEWMIAGKPEHVDPDGTTYVPGYVPANPGAENNTGLNRARAVYKIKDGEYMPMGDNTERSLDGRYFGAVGQKDIVGPAFAVYWPLSPRWGNIRCR